MEFHAVITRVSDREQGARRRVLQSP
jgi:hypothetical protein